MLKKNDGVCTRRQNKTFTYIFMLKPCQNFNFPQRSLAICLVLKWRYFLDGNFCFRYGIISRSAKKKEKVNIMVIIINLLNKFEHDVEYHVQ